MEIAVEEPGVKIIPGTDGILNPHGKRFHPHLLPISGGNGTTRTLLDSQSLHTVSQFLDRLLNMVAPGQRTNLYFIGQEHIGHRKQFMNTLPFFGGIIIGIQ